MDNYQGWTNRPTGDVWLHLTKNAQLYQELRSLARRSESPEDLAGLIKAWVKDELAPEVPGFAGSILDWGLEQVDWEQIAAAAFED